MAALEQYSALREARFGFGIRQSSRRMGAVPRKYNCRAKIARDSEILCRKTGKTGFVRHLPDRILDTGS